MKAGKIKGNFIQEANPTENRKKEKLQGRGDFYKLMTEAAKSPEPDCMKPHLKITSTNAELNKMILNVENLHSVDESEDSTVNGQALFSTIEDSINRLDQFSAELGKPNSDAGRIENILEGVFQKILSKDISTEAKDLLEEIKVAAYTEYIKWKRGDYF